MKEKEAAGISWIELLIYVMIPVVCCLVCVCIMLIRERKKQNQIDIRKSTAQNNSQNFMSSPDLSRRDEQSLKLMDPIDTDRSAKKAPPRRMPTKLPDEEDVENYKPSPSHFPDIYDDMDEEEKDGMEFDENAKTDMIPTPIMELNDSMELGQTVKLGNQRNQNIVRSRSQTFVS